MTIDYNKEDLVVLMTYFTIYKVHFLLLRLQDSVLNTTANV